MSNVIDRRTWLGGVAVLAAAPACAPALAAPAVEPAAGAAGAPAYPPLPPLNDAVYARRHDRLRALARDAGASLVFVTSGTTAFAYLAGGRVERSERLIAMVVPVDGAPFLVAPAFEVERMRRQTRLRDVRPWEEHESPFVIARDAIGAAGAQAKILIEPHTEYQTALALGRAVPGASLVDGTTAFERLRLHKDDDELARIRRAVAVTQDVFEVAFAGLH